MLKKTDMKKNCHKLTSKILKNQMILKMLCCKFELQCTCLHHFGIYMMNTFLLAMC